VQNIISTLSQGTSKINLSLSSSLKVFFIAAVHVNKHSSGLACGGLLSHHEPKGELQPNFSNFKLNSQDPALLLLHPFKHQSLPNAMISPSRPFFGRSTPSPTTPTYPETTETTRAYSLETVKHWKERDVADWLESLNYGQFTQKFTGILIRTDDWKAMVII
jgi:SAM domain (Sterile alpha motif)